MLSSVSMASFILPVTMYSFCGKTLMYEFHCVYSRTEWNCFFHSPVWFCFYWRVSDIKLNTVMIIIIIMMIIVVSGPTICHLCILKCCDVDSVVRESIHLWLNHTCCLIHFAVVLVTCYLCLNFLSRLSGLRYYFFWFSQNFVCLETFSDSSLCLDIGLDLYSNCTRKRKGKQ